LTPDADPMCLLGEAILPELLAEDPALQPFANVGRLLAERTDWPELYDAERLARNEVPVFAAIYAEDMFVPRQLSLQTAAEVPNVHAWLTDAYLHDGIRDGDGVLAQLRAMSARRRTGD